MRWVVRKIVYPLVLCAAAVLLELLAYSAVMSEYALSHWWTAGSVTTIVLHALFVTVSTLAIMTSYATGFVWPVVAAQVVLFGSRAACFGRADALMQGLQFPVALAAAGLFGYIGSGLRQVRLLRARS